MKSYHVQWKNTIYIKHPRWYNITLIHYVTIYIRLFVMIQFSLFFCNTIQITKNTTHRNYVQYCMLSETFQTAKSVLHKWKRLQIYHIFANFGPLKKNNINKEPKPNSPVDNLVNFCTTRWTIKTRFFFWIFFYVVFNTKTKQNCSHLKIKKDHKSKDWSL